MKILLVIPALGPVYGGPSIIAPSFAEALARQGVTVDIVTTDANGSVNLDVPIQTWLEEGGYRVRYFRRIAHAEYKLSFSLLVWLMRHVRDYDLAHAISIFNFPILACALACRLQHVPFVLSPQGMLEPWALLHNGGKKSLYYNLIEKQIVLRVAAAIHALNNNEARNIASLQIGSPMFVIPNGIELDIDAGEGAEAEQFFDRFPATRGKKLILFLHRIDPKKGLDVLASAFAIVRKHYPETHVVVAGPDHANFGPTAHRFFENEGCGGADALTFTGMLEGKLKRAALAAAAIFVAPSYSEGFSISVLEAMAAGLPCVITIGCNFPEVATARAALEVPIDAGAFGQALMQLLNDPPAAQAMGERARRFIIDGYTLDQAAAKAASVYQAISSGLTIPYCFGEPSTSPKKPAMTSTASLPGSPSS